MYGKTKTSPFLWRGFCISLIFIQLQYAHKRFLRNLYVSDLAHSLLSFFCFPTAFSYGKYHRRTLGKHVFSHCSDGLSCDDLASHCCLDRDLKKLSWNLFFELLAHLSSTLICCCTVYNKESASTSSLLIRISSLPALTARIPTSHNRKMHILWNGISTHQRNRK